MGANYLPIENFTTFLGRLALPQPLLVRYKRVLRGFPFTVGEANEWSRTKDTTQQT